ncbi:TetR/AcrR family transcriptional regulator [Rhodococcus sp. NCIMB 12038]|uniref:TetR/AcrR family transcriptional regulator n=1 Tax=Rhodococcus sp. NCIMB 12038 TaxID=933800 RepID=UPI0015C5CE05|nr:TetR/AcrR family transcriptional regulator [Rhodococcus sp. NCIMB 12038]
MTRDNGAGGGDELRHRGGRSRDSSRDLALREAALDLLAEVGYDRLTMDAVAARARAGKTTIYRRWQDKAELVVDSLNSLKGAPDIPDTGSLRQDLHALAEEITSAEGKFGARVTVGMVSALARDAELRQVIREKFMAPRMTGFREVFERAVARGEMSDGHDLDLLAGLFPALALQQLVMSGELPDTEFARQIMDEAVYPLATAPAARIATGATAGGKTYG